MPEGKIGLEEGLADSPHVRAEVGKLEKYLPPFREYTTLLRDTFQACSIHQEKVCEGTDALSKLLNSIQGETIGEQDTFIPKAFFRLSRYLSELNSCQEMLSTQLQNAVIELLSQFLNTDLNNLEKLKENHKAASLEHEQAAAKFSRCSKKKDSEKARFEANAELFSTRRKFYEVSLDYYSELNCFQHKKKFAVLEPLLTFMHAQMAYFKVGHEILSGELANLLTGLNTQVQKVHKEYQDELLTTAQTRANIELRFHDLCLPDPDPADPFTDQPLVPNMTLTTKAGYLFVKTQSGFPAKWDRAYFFTKKGYLYIHTPPKAPELIINLKGAEAVATDVDDRRYAFAISHSSLKRPIYLMAESDHLKDEWVATVNNIGYDTGHAQPRQNVKRDEAVIKLEREKIRSWVNKEIDLKKDKSVIPKIPKVSPVPTPSTSNSQLPAFPSLSTFLNFLDPTSQSNQSENPPQKKSPIFQRRSSSNPKPNEPSGGNVGGMSASEPKDLPSPLQPERLTAGAVSTSNRQQALSFSKTFYVKYLGHMEVSEGRNISMITDTILKVMTARVSRNVKDAQAIAMTITNKSISLYDHLVKKAIGQITLKDILRCAVQPDSVKLFGIVNRTTGDGDKVKFVCHVMEANTTGSQVCSAINEAIQAAIKMLQLTQAAQTSKHTRSKSSNTIPLYQLPKEAVDHPTALPSLNASKSPTNPPPPKSKSASDSNLLSVSNLPHSHSNSITSSQSSLNSAISDDSADVGMLPSSGYLHSPNHTPFPPIGAMPALMENQATVESPWVSNTPQHAVNGHSSDWKEPLPAPTVPGMLAAAASSSEYYQMPSSLQQSGGVTSAESDMDSPLPSLDELMNSSDPPNHPGGDKKMGGSNGSTSIDTGYCQMPNMHTADTNSQPFTLGGSGSVDSGPSYLSAPVPGPVGAPVLGGSGSVDSGSSYLPTSTLFGSGLVDSGSSHMPAPVFGGGDQVDSGSSHMPASLLGGSGLMDSGSSYLPAPSVTSDGMGGAFNNATSATGWDSLDFCELSSSDTVFDVSSSSQQSATMLDVVGRGVGNPATSSTNSGYFPVPMGAESMLATPNQSAESSFIPGNVSSSSASGFPGPFPGFEEDLDDFDLPPLPDSVELPGQAGSSSYGGSIVTFGTSRSPQN